MKEKDILQLMQKMTLEQKLGQMSLCEFGDLMQNSDNAFTGPKGEFALTASQKKLVGGVLNFKGAAEMIGSVARNLEALFTSSPLSGMLYDYNPVLLLLA